MNLHKILNNSGLAAVIKYLSLLGFGYKMTEGYRGYMITAIKLSRHSSIHVGMTV